MVRLWDLAARCPLAVLEGHADTVTAVDASADGARAASASVDGTARLWDLRRRTAIRVLEGHGAQVAAVRLSPDGQVVATGAWDGTARLWDAESGSALGALEGQEGNVTAVALHGLQVATGGADGAIRVWDARTRRTERRLLGHDGEVTGLAFTPDGRFVLSASRDHSVRVWDLRRGEAVRTLPHPALVLGLALSPVGSILLTAGADRCARVWHLDWEPEAAPGATAPPAGTAPLPAARTAQGPLRTRVTTTVPAARTTTLRDDLRRAAPVAVPALPRAARRLPWRRIAVGLGLLAAAAVAWRAWQRPSARVRLSPYMAEAVPRELDLIDLGPFGTDCSPGEYERHLERVRSGNPDARDVACLADEGTPAVVADVLEGAPLDSPDATTARRLRRNAASALAGLRGEAVGAVCARLGDEREEASAVAAMALGILDDPAASTCVRDTLAAGGAAARPAAAALRQRVTRGLFPVDEAWAITASLLVSPDPVSRRAGLLLAPVFSGRLAEPAVRPLLDDPDPDVAVAARESHASVERVLQADRLREDAGS
jgi:hypothetical protein